MEIGIVILSVVREIPLQRRRENSTKMALASISEILMWRIMMRRTELMKTLNYD